MGLLPRAPPHGVPRAIDSTDSRVDTPWSRRCVAVFYGGGCRRRQSSCERVGGQTAAAPKRVVCVSVYPPALLAPPHGVRPSIGMCAGRREYWMAAMVCRVTFNDVRDCHCVFAMFRPFSPPLRAPSDASRMVCWSRWRSTGRACLRGRDSWFVWREHCCGRRACFCSMRLLLLWIMRRITSFSLRSGAAEPPPRSCGRRMSCHLLPARLEGGRRMSLVAWSQPFFLGG